jgi:transcriptional regulator with GAF, ATPase, and Fis domain
MIELEVTQGELSGQLFSIDLPFVTIGRLEENKIVITDYHISGEHAQIFWEEDQYILRDLRSTNGSMMKRGKKVIHLDGKEREVSITQGDEILLGAPYTPVKLICKKLTPPSGVDQIGRTTKVVFTKSIDDLENIRGKVELDQNLAANMYRMVQTIGRGGLKLEKVLKAVSDAVFNLIKTSTNISIYLRSVHSSRFKMVFSISRDPNITEGCGSRSLIQMVTRKKAGVVLADAPEELSNSESIVTADIRSIMAVPFWNGNKIIGVLQCDNRGKSGLFHEKDLEYLTLLSYQATLAIENASLYQRLEENRAKVQSENTYFKTKTTINSFDDIIGDSDAMKSIFKQLQKVLDTRVAIHVKGETGTGKELIATAIHYQSRRKEKMFIAQNCAALTETLLESELFGHEKGAFTGAEKSKKGLFEIADGGTLFLDEVADMSPGLQVKLLRVLQEGEIRPVGSTTVKFVDVRIISATHKNLEEEVSTGRFREDLFYRLHVFPISLPPLRDRKDDIALLVSFFMDKFCNELQKEVKIASSTIDEMKEYKWKGNIRELENEVQRLVILADDDGVIEPSDLSPHQRKDSSLMAEKAYIKGVTLKKMVEEVEKAIIKQALSETAGNKTKAAKNLGITREGLHKKISKYQMNTKKS